jgi:hypothetical protein
VAETASGGRTWWAHFEFTRINIAPIILRKKIEELSDVVDSGVPAAALMGHNPGRQQAHFRRDSEATLPISSSRRAKS